MLEVLLVYFTYTELQGWSLVHTLSIPSIPFHPLLQMSQMLNLSNSDPEPYLRVLNRHPLEMRPLFNLSLPPEFPWYNPFFFFFNLQAS